MRKLSGLASVGLIAIGLSVAALAASPPTRVRGTIAAITGDTVTVQGYDGGTTAVMLRPDTRFAWVVRSSLSQIAQGDFIGTGATGPDSALVALEVVIFPAAMRGAGEGHYPWSIPAAVAKADAGGGAVAVGTMPVQGTMTNGTVAAVQGTMTNGTVTSGTAAAAGGRTMTITFDKGHEVQVTVPPNVPVVRFEPGQSSILKTGDKVFIVAVKREGSDALTANFIAVGKDGLMPPM